MTHLDLCSGIGGFALAAQWVGFETIGFSEIDEYASRVLTAHWPNVRNYGDIRKLTGVSADLVTAGFPCQPFSTAGKQRGKADDRYLWPEVFRVVQESKPTWVLCENVAGIDGLALEDCVTNLESIGYEIATFEIPACAVGATHVRNRVWILAYSERSEWRKQSHNGSNRRMGRFEQPISWHGDWQNTLREFRGVDDGLSYGVDRIDCLRNAIVPQVAYQILKTIAQVEEMVSDSETG